MQHEVYSIPCGEKISVHPDGYKVVAMNNRFESHTVAWFQSEQMANEFAKYLCSNFHNCPSFCEENSQWAKEVRQ